MLLSIRSMGVRRARRCETGESVRAEEAGVIWRRTLIDTTAAVAVVGGSGRELAI